MFPALTTRQVCLICPCRPVYCHSIVSYLFCGILSFFLPGDLCIELLYHCKDHGERAVRCVPICYSGASAPEPTIPVSPESHTETHSWSNFEGSHHWNLVPNPVYPFFAPRRESPQRFPLVLVISFLISPLVFCFMNFIQYKARVLYRPDPNICTILRKRKADGHLNQLFRRSFLLTSNPKFAPSHSRVTGIFFSPFGRLRWRCRLHPE